MTPAEHFDRNGFWITPEPIFSKHELERFTNSIRDVMTKKYESGRRPMAGRNFPRLTDPQGLIQISNIWWTGGAVKELTLDARPGKLATDLLACNGVVLWHDQLLYKPPLMDKEGRSGNVGFHQDWDYWQVCDRPDIVTASVALVDVSRDNGALMMAPGSHNWGSMGFKVGELAVEENRHRIRDPEGRKAELVYCEMPAGSVSFHHCKTLHGSGPNHTDSPRICVSIHYLAEHVRYNASRGATHTNLQICPREDGELFRGDQHPVIFSR
jgi:ectoine hydroxylase-related dioxygenase (phytanoyl-CoA dioxygenase family)